MCLLPMKRHASSAGSLWKRCSDPNLNITGADARHRPGVLDSAPRPTIGVSDATPTVDIAEAAIQGLETSTKPAVLHSALLQSLMCSCRHSSMLAIVQFRVLMWRE